MKPSEILKDIPGGLPSKFAEAIDRMDKTDLCLLAVTMTIKAAMKAKVADESVLDMLVTGLRLLKVTSMIHTLEMTLKSPINRVETLFVMAKLAELQKNHSDRLRLLDETLIKEPFNG